VNITLYTKETAPHEPVEETRPRGSLLSKEAWKAHEANPENHRAPYGPLCGACHWSDPAVRKARAEKLPKLRAFQRTGKLPAAWMKPTTIKFGGALLSDKEAGRVVLPRFPLPDYYHPSAGPEGEWISRPISRYLEAMGEHEVEGGHSHDVKLPPNWSCGCRVWIKRVEVVGTREMVGGRPSQGMKIITEAATPCDRHKRALRGRDEE
jgi:hypothetical protein